MTRRDPSPGAQPWSESLEQLHQESSRTHFLDVWTRTAMISRLGAPRDGVTNIFDIGCSTGYLLEDLRLAFPNAALVGLDFIYSGLRAARDAIPDCSLVQADAQHLPFAFSSADAIVSANLLEHVPDDVGALHQMYDVIAPGGTVIIVVPAGRRLYDYYDRFLYHQRRYGGHELVAKARSVGFDVIDDFYLGSLIYPAFWVVKKRNRLLRSHLVGEALQRQVASDIAHTKDSLIGRLTTRLERLLLANSVQIPFGVRELAVLQRPL